MNIIIILLALIATIAIHELGHYLAARACQTAISRFSIGFGKPTWSWTNQRGTEWRISPWMLGGYVEMPEANQLSKTIQGTPFRQQTLFKRAIIILAGPCMNFVFAWALFSGALALDLEHPKALVGHIIENSIADKAKLRPNDHIIAIDNQATPTWPSAIQALLQQLGQTRSVPILIERNRLLIRENLDLSLWRFNELQPKLLLSLGIEAKKPDLPPIIDTIKKNSPADSGRLQANDQITAIKLSQAKGWTSVTQWPELRNWIEAHPNQSVSIRIQRGNDYVIHTTTLEGKGWFFPKGSLGIQIKLPPRDPSFYLPVNFNHASIPSASLNLLTETVTFQWNMITLLVSGKISLQTLGGPASLYHASASALHQGTAQFLFIIAVINAMIALLNLLPLPILDGGQLVMLIIEGIRKKPLSARYEQLFYHIGIILIALLMVQAIINDLLRLTAP